MRNVTTVAEKTQITDDEISSRLSDFFKTLCSFTRFHKKWHVVTFSREQPYESVLQFKNQLETFGLKLRFSTAKENYIKHGLRLQLDIENDRAEVLEKLSNTPVSGL